MARAGPEGRDHLQCGRDPDAQRSRPPRRSCARVAIISQRSAAPGFCIFRRRARRSSRERQSPSWMRENPRGRGTPGAREAQKNLRRTHGPRRLAASRHSGRKNRKSAGPAGVPRAVFEACSAEALEKRPNILHWWRTACAPGLHGLGRPMPRHATRPLHPTGRNARATTPTLPGVPGPVPKFWRRIRRPSFGCFRTLACHDVRPRLKQGERNIVALGINVNTSDLAHQAAVGEPSGLLLPAIYRSVLNVCACASEKVSEPRSLRKCWGLRD
jgi:hypothetical protein